MQTNKKKNKSSMNHGNKKAITVRSQAD